MNAQPTLPTTFDGHLDLLAEKGFLEGPFAANAGSWLLDFRDQYDRSRATALMEKKKTIFTVEATGKFNEHLDEVYFQLRYQIDPRKDTLSLLTLKTRLDRTRWTYFLNGRQSPPTASEVYQKLRKMEGPKRDTKLLGRIQRSFNRQNDPNNDPHLDMHHPGFHQTNDLHKDPEDQQYPPNDLSSFFSRPSRRLR